jgi:hypothetical protein
MVETNTTALACVISTYDRVWEAKGQIDIIRDLWQPRLGSIDIYHEYNGQPEWYDAPYREDYLFRHANESHFEGSVHLMERGIEHVLQSGKTYDYIVVASADAWLYNPDKIINLIALCRKKNYAIASSIWYFSGLATEFFIITPQLARLIFPLHFEEIIGRSALLGQFNHYARTSLAFFVPWLRLTTVEFYFGWKALKNAGGWRRIALIPGREFVFITNRFYSKGFYASHHDVKKRQQLLAAELQSVVKQWP